MNQVGVEEFLHLLTSHERGCGEHILTWPGGSTGINTLPTGEICWIEHREVVEQLLAAIYANKHTAVVLRTFDEQIAYISDTGVDIPYKTVRGWTVYGGQLHAISGENMMEDSCHSRTGQILSPERGVTYKDAHDVHLF